MRTCRILLMALSGLLMLPSCHKNDLKLFTDYYFAFEPSLSSSTTINQDAEMAGQYVIHFCTAKRESSVSVVVDIIPGDGLKEGVDYKVVTSPNVKFAPGVYDKTFIIEWLPHKLDPTKDNSLTLRLKECSDDSIILGLPGPSQKYRSITIYKTL